MHFEKVKLTTKKGKEVTNLKAVTTPANISYLTDFSQKFSQNFVFHSNHVKHYRSTIHKFKENFDLIIDIDFSENLPVQFSLFCSKLLQAMTTFMICFLFHLIFLFNNIIQVILT